MADTLDKTNLRAWVVSADMGLGHKRATYPLRKIAEGGIIVANSASFAEKDELRLWEQMKSVYERLSRVKSVPIVGETLFGIMDYFQSIKPAYPRVNLAHRTIQTRFVDTMIAKGLCSTMLKKIREKPLPLVSSFFQTSIAADKAGWGRVYCIICDADINRVWVTSDPRVSRINYFVPCGSALRRLKQYGVPDERIFMTGFPFPLELLGNEDLDVLKSDLGTRLSVLDPAARFKPLHGLNVEHFLGAGNAKKKASRPPTIAFAVGGAGAQKEIGVAALKSLAKKLKAGECGLNLVCGVRREIADYFRAAIAEYAPSCENVRIISGSTDSEYFDAFNDSLHGTDILWTKPSELSFYAGLGLPIIAAPSIGSQEQFNKQWLNEIQACFDQHDPAFAHEWIFEYLENGRFAEAAWSGFLKARKYGTYKIMEILSTGTMARESSPLKR